MGKRILTEEQKQARREYNKRYREEHREIENARQKRFRENNPDKIKESKRKYRETHQDVIKAAYDRHLAKLGKTRRPVLTEEEKEAKRLEAKEKTRKHANERCKENFVSVEKTCRYCGKSFMTEYKKSKNFCSEECQAKRAHYMRKLADKRRHGKITTLERLDTDITLPLLFDRDRGVCKICGRPCDWDDIETSDNVTIAGKMYPSIDHIKPISKGGSHTWDNVQLAHKYCNSIKSDN